MAAKLNTVLSLVRSSKEALNALTDDLLKKFKSHTDYFSGTKKTFDPRWEDVVVQPSWEGYTKLVSSPDEQLAYYLKYLKKHTDATLARERSNIEGTQKMSLVVRDIDMGSYYPYELLQLRSTVAKVKRVIEAIPTRDVRKEWVKADPDTEDHEASLGAYKVVQYHQQNTTTKTSVIPEDEMKVVEMYLKEGKDYTPRRLDVTTPKELGTVTQVEYTTLPTSYRKIMWLTILGDLNDEISVLISKAETETNVVESDDFVGKLSTLLFGSTQTQKQQDGSEDVASS